MAGLFLSLIMKTTNFAGWVVLAFSRLAMDIPRPFMKRLARPQGHGRLPIDLHQDGTLQYVQGTGGVSTFALQFAVAGGARVIVTSSSEEKLARARALGVRDGINYKAEPDHWEDRADADVSGVSLFRESLAWQLR